jgi:hypothetical protein
MMLWSASFVLLAKGFVILSEVNSFRQDVLTQSKDPSAAGIGRDASRHSRDELDAAL